MAKRLIWSVFILLLGISAVIFAAFEQDTLSDLFLFAMFFVLGLSFLIIEKKKKTKWRILQYTAGVFLMAYSVVRIEFLMI